MNISFTNLVVVGNQGRLITNNFNASEKYYRELKTLLKIRRVKNFPFVRVGRANDGGYIMVNDFKKSGGGGSLFIRHFQ